MSGLFNVTKLSLKALYYGHLSTKHINKFFIKFFSMVNCFLLHADTQ